MRLLELEQDYYIKFDDNWVSFLSICNTFSTDTSKEEALSKLNISPDIFNRLIIASIYAWRNSISESLLHAISFTDKPKGNIFPDFLWQTRFLTKLIEYRYISRWDTKSVIKNGKQLLINNTPALTVINSETNKKVNDIIRMIYVYKLLNNLKTGIKLPKFIYRGIRASNLFNHDTFATAVSAIWQSDKEYDMKRKEAYDLLIKWICDKKLHQITDSKFLSFTSSLPIANYFSNGEGLVLRVDPTKVDIVTSVLHDDDEMNTPDPVTGKLEKEFIIKIPNNYDFKPEDIIINDINYFIAEQNPLCVALFDHSDKSATYKLNALDITAYAYWRNNDKLVTVFNIPNSSIPFTRVEFKKQFGFDPMPTTQNLHKIKDFKFIRKKTY